MNQRSKKNIIGVIPAAGKGSRLAPFPCPKELFPVGYQNYRVKGKTERRPKVISQYLIENMLHAGAGKFLIIISEGKGDIMKYYGDGTAFGTHISYLFQEEQSGMPGAINLAQPWVGDATVLFGMPDTIIEPKDAFQRLLDTHYKEENDLTLGLFTTHTPSKFGMVRTDKDGRVLTTIDKPKKTALKNMWGCACWEPSFTRLMAGFLKAHEKTSSGEIVLGQVFNEAIRQKLKVGSHTFVDGKYIDIGTTSELDMALKIFHL